MRPRYSKLAAAALSVSLTCLALEGAARADDPPQVHEDAPEVQHVEQATTFELAGDSVIVRTKAREWFIKIGCRAQSFASVGTTAYALCTVASSSPSASSTVVIVEVEPEPHVVQRRAILSPLMSLTVIDGVISARSAFGVKPLADYSVAPANVVVAPRTHTLSLHGPLYSTTPPPAVGYTTPELNGLELSLVGTSGIGFDGPVGGYGVLQAEIAYRFKAPLFLAAYGTFGAGTGQFNTGMEPPTTNGANGGANGGDVQVAAGEAIIGVDTRFIALGVGAGAALMQDGYDVEPIVAFRGRFGERDRFDFTWHMAFATGGPNVVGLFGGMLEFRLTSSVWLGVDAELGNERFGRFMVDARFRLAGHGAHGTVDLRTGFGLAYVQTSTNTAGSTSPCNGQSEITQVPGNTDVECIGTNADYLGPALSLGLVWRP
jgi:hypothetical protein